MRSPSSRILANSVDYYAATQAQGLGGGVQYGYPAMPTIRGLAASVQPGATEEVLDEDRLIQERQYKIVLGQPLNVSVRDKFVWVDRAGVTHTLFAHVTRDEAGRGAAFVVRAVERL